MRGSRARSADRVGEGVGRGQVSLHHGAGPVRRGTVCRVGEVILVRTDEYSAVVRSQASGRC